MTQTPDTAATAGDLISRMERICLYEFTDRGALIHDCELGQITFGDIEDLCSAIRALPAAPASAGVTVKPLEWEGAEDDCYVIAETMIGTYEVSVCDTLEMAHHYVWDCKVQLHNPRRQESVKCQRQSSFLDAKAAAQADYERRILAALSQPAQGGDSRPVNCRFRLQDEGKPYPRSSCQACGKGVFTGLGNTCAQGGEGGAV